MSRHTSKLMRLAVLTVFVALCSAAFAFAQEPAAEAPANSAKLARAFLVPVPLPISAVMEAQVRGQIEQILELLPAEKEPRPLLVLEFRPKSGQGGEGTSFGAAYELATFLTGEKLRGVRTIGWLPGTDAESAVKLRGHALLPLLACEEIIMSPFAELGDAGHDAKTVTPAMRHNYEEIANQRRAFPPAFAVGLLDKQLEVIKVESLDGVRYVLQAELEELRKKAPLKNELTVKRAGVPAQFTGSDLRVQYQFVSQLAKTHEELTLALGLPPGAIELNAALAGDWRAVRIDLRRPISHREVQRLQTTLNDRLRQDPFNLLLLYIDSPGGSLVDSKQLADYLASLGEQRVRTVAFVPRHALGDAALVALGCDHVVLQHDARLGGPGAAEWNDMEREDLRIVARDLAEKKGRSPALVIAAVDHNTRVHRYSKPGQAGFRYAAENEPPEPGWERGRPVNNGDGLSAADALELGLAQYVVANDEELFQLYNIENVEELRPNWALQFIQALASPRIAGFLLFLGILMLLMEWSHPGVSVFAFVASLCFLLFFWSQFLQGTAGWLELLLFVGGVSFLAIEIFVLPGFGIFGLGGGAMVLVSLVLASQTFVIPRNSYQLDTFSTSLGMVMFSLLGVGVALVLLRKYIHRAPVVSRVMLGPPDARAIQEQSRREALVDYNHLLGKGGVTTSPLMPSGRAKIGDQSIDVMSEGELVPRGANVVVVDVRGSTVVVRRTGVE